MFSNTDFAKLDREDKEGRALFQRLVILTFADRDVQIETKLRLKYFKAGTGWDLEQLRADVAELEAVGDLLAVEDIHRGGARHLQRRAAGHRLQHARHMIGQGKHRKRGTGEKYGSSDPLGVCWELGSLPRGHREGGPEKFSLFGQLRSALIAEL